MRRRRGPLATDQALLDRIRDAVHEVEPGARVILYGSRARGDAAPDSDWDLLVLVDGPVDHRREDAIRHRMFNVALDTDSVLSTIVRSAEVWQSPLYRAMPFHENVERDGVEL